jgi:hypothetical protein
LTKSETPAVETRSEGDGTLVRINLDITEGVIVVGRDNDVHGLNCTKEGLIKILFGHLKLEKSAVDLVYDDDGLDPLAKSLTKDGLSLHTNTLNAIYDDEGAVCHTKGGCDFRGEIDVSRRIDKIDQELMA